MSWSMALRSAAVKDGARRLDDSRPGLGMERVVRCKDLGLASCVLGSSAPPVRWAV